MTIFGVGTLISEEFYYTKFRKTQESKFKWSLKKQIRLIYLQETKGNNLNWNTDNMPRQIIDFRNKCEVWY